MIENEWLESADVEALLHELWRNYPQMQWTDRKPRLLVFACCQPVLGVLPNACRDLLCCFETAADCPVSPASWETAFDRAEQAAREAGQPVQNLMFAVGYGDLGLACYEVHQILAAASGGPSRTPDASDDAADTFVSRRSADCVRDIFGNPFRPVTFDPSWRSPTVASLAKSIYGERAFARMPELADALEAAGCTDADILAHCRQRGDHVRGCWVIDLVLGKA